ncbi:transposase [Mesorhizobium sp. BHbsci]
MRWRSGGSGKHRHRSRRPKARSRRPRRYESGEVSRNGRVSKRGDKLTRTHLYEAANVILTRQIGFSSLKAWGPADRQRCRIAKVAVAQARRHPPRHVEDE